MAVLARFFRYTASRRRAARRAGRAAAALERLEDRTLLAGTVIDPGERLDLVGRASDGTWWASSPHPDVPGAFEDRIVGTWNPAGDWRHVLSDDFDGDGLDDLAGWDAAGGIWFVSLSEPVGSTNLVAGAWSNATVWSDVAVLDVYADGKGADLVGRDQWGHWWAAVANGNGTFRNILLTSWLPDARWQDVKFFDLNRDGTTDIVGRDRWGNWWAAENLGDGAFQNRFLTSWTPTAGWRDATVVSGFDEFSDGVIGDFRNAVAARASDGGWWAWSVREDGSVETRFLMSWNEAAGWHDVLAANISPDSWTRGGPVAHYGEQIVGRTATGDWYALDPWTLTTKLIGTWNEAAGWQDVEAVTFRTERIEYVGLRETRVVVTDADHLVGRTSDGEWWIAGWEMDGPLTSRPLGRWNEAAAWQDVHTADNVGTPVEVSTVIEGVLTPIGLPFHQARPYVTIYAHPAGTAATVKDLTPPYVGGPVPISIRYAVPPLGMIRTFEYALSGFDAWEGTIVFEGAEGGDAYVGLSARLTIARGGAGDDLLDARNGHPLDQLFGGPGIDVLLGDEPTSWEPGDLKVQDS